MRKRFFLKIEEVIPKESTLSIGFEEYKGICYDLEKFESYTSEDVETFTVNVNQGLNQQKV